MAGLLLLALTFLVSLLVGRFFISPEQVFKILLAGPFEVDGHQAASIVWKLRLPRAILSALCGAGLAVAGASFQGIFKNPLVSPDILGVTSGAAFGAALGILLSGVNLTASLLAMAFGMISVFLTWTLAGLRKGGSTLSLVLAGIIISAVFSALTSLIKYVADPYDKLPAITYWLMGSFSNAGYEACLQAGAPIAAGACVLILLRWRINVISLGEEEAAALGLNPARIRLLIIVLCTLIASSSVMIAGVIGWVGLVIPHICRMISGVNHQSLLPMSAVIGAVFLLAVDAVARTATAAEIPIGILTALIGAPFFAFIFKKIGGGWK